MNNKIFAFRSVAVSLSMSLFLGCTKPDLTISELSVVHCSGGDIRYSYTVLNRDYTGNMFVGPGPVEEKFGVQAWLSSTTTLNQYDAAEQAAGGLILVPERDFGADRILSPGETVSQSFTSSVSHDMNVTPNLIMKVDGRNIFDPESTRAGVIDEYNENNNERWIPIGSCN